jgi:heptosyltransferase I
MRVLFIKLGSIGDIIHTLPALAYVRHSMPDAVVSWVVEQRSAEILRGNPFIDCLIEIDTHSLRGGHVIEEMLIGAGRQVRELRKNAFDIAIDLQGLLKSALVAQLSGAKRRWGFARESLREPASRFLLSDVADTPKGTHVIYKNLALVRQALDLVDDPGEPEFPIATEVQHRLEANALTAMLGHRFAVLNPAGGWVTKLWPAERFGQLADRLWDEHGMRSLVVTGPRETGLAAEVRNASRSGTLQLAEPSLKGFYELVKQASVYVGGDTGPTHIAVAAGAPVVGLFGPTEWWRNGSPRPDDICVERLDVGCRVDCHRRTCSEWICMDITVDRVVNAVTARISSHSASPVSVLV